MLDPSLAVKRILWAGYRAYSGAGSAAKRIVSRDRDITTQGDLAAAGAMIGYARGYPEIGVVYTEERGTVRLNPSGTLSLVIDDVDGTKNSAMGLGLPHGSIAGIFDGDDPSFGDCLAAGFLNFPTRTLFSAERGKGAYETPLFSLAKQHRSTRLKTSGRTELVGTTPLNLIPDFWMLGSLSPAFAEYGDTAQLANYKSAGFELALVASGRADIQVVADNAPNPNKHRTGEEVGPLSLLVKESGGAAVDWRGRDVSSQKVGMAEGKTHHMVFAATPQLARRFVDDFARKPLIAEYMQKKGL